MDWTITFYSNIAPIKKVFKRNGLQKESEMSGQRDFRMILESLCSWNFFSEWIESSHSILKSLRFKLFLRKRDSRMSMRSNVKETSEWFWSLFDLENFLRMDWTISFYSKIAPIKNIFKNKWIWTLGQGDVRIILIPFVLRNFFKNELNHPIYSHIGVIKIIIRTKELHNHIRVSMSLDSF